MSDNDATIVTLHRYFVWAVEMKRSFETTAANRPQPLSASSDYSGPPQGLRLRAREGTTRSRQPVEKSAAPRRTA